jgi:hypothetical protein
VAWRYHHFWGLPLGQLQAQEMHAVNGNAHTSISVVDFSPMRVSMLPFMD